MPVSAPATAPAPQRPGRFGRAARWALGLTLAAVLGLAAIGALGTGLVVAAAQAWSGVGLTGRATASVLSVEPRETYDDLRIRYDAGGRARTATLTWTASDTPPPGALIEVAYDPDDPGQVRHVSEVDPDAWSAGWHPELWILAGTVLLHLGTAAVAITAILALKAPPRPARPPRPPRAPRRPPEPRGT
jgi:hypothetical protein